MKYKIATIALLFVTVAALSGVYVRATTQHTTWYSKADKLVVPANNLMPLGW